MEPVKSSQVKAVGYDHGSKTLTVEFHGGGTYEYHNVDPKHHHGLMSAQSVGSYLHKHIKSKHAHRKKS